MAAYLELQKLHPNEMHIRNLLGELYLKTGNYADALSVFQHVYNVNPNADHALHNLIAAYHHYARSLSDAEDYTTAIQLLEEALRLTPTDLNLRLSLANAYQGAEDYERAATEISRVLAQTPENPQAKAEQINLKIRRGNALMRERQHTAALAELRRFLNLGATSRFTTLSVISISWKVNMQKRSAVLKLSYGKIRLICLLFGIYCR